MGFYVFTPILFLLFQIFFFDRVSGPDWLLAPYAAKGDWDYSVDHAAIFLIQPRTSYAQARTLPPTSSTSLKLAYQLLLVFVGLESTTHITHISSSVIRVRISQCF